MKSLITLIFCFIYISLSAQIIEIPLSDNPVLRQQSRQTDNSDRTIVLDLPFFDDFSYSGPFPDPEKWEDKKVFINNSFGYQPPSLGYATFDGLDEHGKRYAEEYGTSDTLTSRAIDLTSSPNDLTLSYYLQAKGLGEKPEFKDSLILQFRDSDLSWETQTVYYGWSGHLDSIPEFSRYEFDIPSEYIHQNFQFRFINWSGNYGIMDIWNLDYVHLSNSDVTDIAFTKQPNEILTGYRSMPLKHFAVDVEKYLIDSVHINVRNLGDVQATAEPSSLIIRAKDAGFDFFVNETLLELPPIVDVNQRDLNPGLHYFRNRIQQIDEYKMAIQSLPFGILNAIDIITEYSFEEGGDHFVNDTCAITTTLSNYFAYDDGTAENAISANVGESGNPTLANSYYAEVDDTLSAVQIMFPRTINIADNQAFTLKIWTGSLDKEADFQVKNLKPIYIDNAQDTFQAYTTYRLTGDLSGEDTFMIIPQGDFFVGLYQITTGTDGVPIGFDKNTPRASSNIWFHDGQNWENLGADFVGALMIRPMFGFDVPPTTINAVSEVDFVENQVKFYPNPFSNTLSIEPFTPWYNGYIEIFSSEGKRLIRKEIRSNKVDTDGLNPGIYAVRIIDKTGKESVTSLLIKQ